jgi:DNA adenine methylase
MDDTIAKIQLPKNTYGTPTPLRYPGGKSVAAGLMAQIIKKSNEVDGKGITTYVEPYAGGAGAGVALLVNDVVSNIVINDLDKAVYSFWDTVKYRHKLLINLILNTPITMNQWNIQKVLYNEKNARTAGDRLKLAFAFFFLNRTNRSGILEGGVVGGKNQSGDYKLDARYKKEILVSKIEKLAKYKGHISVLNNDGAKVFAQYKTDTRTLIYLDPPYVQQGRNLYLSAFSKECHTNLSSEVASNKDSNWIMTYDDDELIKDLYATNNLYKYQLRYTAQKKRHDNELLICSDTIKPIIEKMAIDDTK